MWQETQSVGVPANWPFTWHWVQAHGDVGAGQREFGERIVIERRRLPCRRGVAALAGLREACLHMVRIGCLLEIGEVATHAGRRSASKFPANVAGVAFQRKVRSSQREAGEFQMVKLGARTSC